MLTWQTVDLAKVDVQKLSAGYRASKVIGSSVLNDTNETIGKDRRPPRQSRRKGAIRCVIDRWFPGHGRSFGYRPLRQFEACRKQDRAAGQHKGHPQNAA
jgi:hypothetical protein